MSQTRTFVSRSGDLITAEQEPTAPEFFWLRSEDPTTHKAFAWNAAKHINDLERIIREQGWVETTPTTTGPANPVARMAPETRTKRLHDSFARNDRVKESTRHPGEWLVSSSSTPNLWYRVRYDTTAKQYGCGCAWWARTATACRHLTRVSWEVSQARKSAAAAA